MININLKVLINESDMTKVDDHIIESILELVEEDISLDTFIKYRIDKLKDYGINNIVLDYLKVMPVDTLCPMLYERHDDIESIIYSTLREGVYVVVTDGKYDTDNKSIRLLSIIMNK